MRRLFRVLALAISVLVVFGFITFTFAEAQSLPPAVKTVSWNTAQKYMVSIMPIKYESITVGGQNVTMAVQVNMPDTNLFSGSVFAEQVIIVFISNSSSFVVHAYARITSASINGTPLYIQDATTTTQYVSYGAVYSYSYNGLTNFKDVSLPEQEIANVSVFICHVFGPYWTTAQKIQLAVG